MWPVIKTKGDDDKILLPIVVNNDKTEIRHPRVVGGQDDEIDGTLNLADELQNTYTTNGLDKSDGDGIDKQAAE